MANSNSIWTWEQDKAFEIAFTRYLEDFEDNWDKIAAQIPGNKTIEDVKQHYQKLLEDILSIESGTVPLPSYANAKAKAKDKAKVKAKAKLKVNNVNAKAKVKTGPCNGANGSATLAKDGNETGWATRKGKMWTEEEHKLFLMGMATYGKGDWKGIAKDFVKTRNATQVASHAQKHFNRQEKKQAKEVKRWSIFDITNPSQDQGGCTYNSRFDFGSSSNNNNSHSYDTTGVTYEMASIMNEAKNMEMVQVMQQPHFSFVDTLDYLSPPESWCLDDDDLDLAIKECISQLPPL